MRIKKIEIENFRGLSKKAEINLVPNNNLIDKTIETGYFKKSGKTVTPNIIGFIGRNGVGKTTIIDAIMKNFMKNSNAHIGEGVALSLNQKMIKDPIAANVLQIQDTLIDYREIILGNNKTKLNWTEENFKQLQEIDRNHFKNIYLLDVHKNGDKIKISTNFVNEKGEEILQSLSELNEEIKMNKKFKELWNVKYETNVLYLGVDNYFDLNNVNPNFKNEVLNFFGEEKMEEYLKIADSNIKKINIEKFVKNMNFNRVLREDGTEISYENLSYGTKRFIYIIYNIEKMARNNENSIILIDELSNYMHDILCDFIFKRINQINKKKNVQLFFTTHNPKIIELLDFKQSFLIDENDFGEMNCKKISSIEGMRDRSSFTKKYLEQKIYLHPSKTIISSVLAKDFEC